MTTRLTAMMLPLLLSALAPAQSLPDLSQHDLSLPVAEARSYDLGDVDGDGCDDYGMIATSVGVPLTPAGTLRAVVVSGRTGLVIHELFGNTAPLWLNPAGLTALPTSFHALPDLDLDGCAEYAYVTAAVISYISVIAHPQLVIRSGATNAVLSSMAVAPSQALSLETFDALTATDDVTGDGVPDIALAGRAGIPYFPNVLDVSYLDVIDGATFQRTSLVYYTNIALIPGGLVAIGDADGDGIPDLAASSASTSLVAPGGGSVTAYSGATGQPLWSRAGAAMDALGKRLIGLGDNDGDGVRELASLVAGSDFAGPDAGLIEIYAGATGGVLFHLAPALGDRFVGLFEGGDTDVDGIQDLVVEIEDVLTLTRRRELRSGLSGLLIRTLSVQDDVVGDLNGDGIDDLVTYAADQPAPGQTRFQAHARLGALSYGSSSGSPDYRWVPGTASPANGALLLSGAPPATPLIGLVSFAPDNTLVSGTNLPLLVSIAPADLYGVYFHTTDALGRHVDPLNLAQPALAGIRVYIQYGVLSPTADTTNAVELMFGPF